MKTNLKRIGKRSVSVILTLMMIVSTMIVGTVTSHAVNITSGTTLYLQPTSNWDIYDAWYAAYFYGGDGEEWVEMTEVEEGIYSVTSEGTHTNVIFVRMNPANTLEDKWDGKWAQTGDLTYDGTKNLYVISSGSGNGAWSANIYTPPVTEVTGITADAQKTDNGTDWSTGGGTVNIASSTVDDEGTTVTVTSTDAGYQFAGWVSSGSGTFADATSATTTYYPADDNEVATAEFKKIYNVTTGTYTNGTVTGSSTALAGESYTLTITPASGYSLETLTVNGTDVTAQVSSNKYVGTATADVTVGATFEQTPQYTLTAVSADTKMGIVSTSTQTADKGTTVSVTATANSGYAFSSWTVLSGTLPTGTSTSSATISFAITSDVKLQANFVADPGTKTSNYLIYGTTGNDPATLTNSIPIYKTSSGQYVARFTGIELDMTKNYYFALSSTTTYTGMYWSGNGGGATVSANPTGYVTVQQQSYNKDGKDYYFGYFKITSDEVTDITISVGYDNNGNIDVTNQDSTYVVIPTIETLPDDAIKVYAKNGTEGGTANYGTTTATIAVDDLYKEASDGGYYNLYTAKQGADIKVSTTIGADYSDNYYVHAFVVSGKTFEAVQDPTNPSTYTCEFLATNDLIYNQSIEITPVYYLNACKNEGEFLRFYVDAAELNTDVSDDNGWGKTISSYSYYYNGNNTTNSDGSTTYGAEVADGAYPGQPMLFDEGTGMYYALMPKEVYSSYAGENVPVSGITINNYKNDSVHNSVLGLKSNCQSYDYDDFTDINNLGMDMAILDIKHRTTNANYSDVNGTNSVSLSTFANGNGWDDFVDVDGNPTDILGGEVTDTSRTIYIVSTSDDVKDNVGQWSTVWYVYDETGKYITSGNSSDFIPRPEGTDDSAAITAIKNGGYEGVQAKISFEKEREYTGPTYRLDGRWYYTTTEEEVTANVKVEYPVYDADGKKTDEWTETVPEGDSASAAYIDGAPSVTYPNRTTTATLTAVPTNEYIFVGWYRLDENGNYIDLGNDSLTTTAVISENFTFVARFEKLAEGTLALAHSKYTGEGTHNGSGYYYVTATYTDHQDETEKTVTSESGGLIQIPVQATADQDEVIKVTLKTISLGEDTFLKFYDDAGPIAAPEDEGVVVSTDGRTVTYTFEIEVWRLFSGNEQVEKIFRYYSDIGPVSKNCVLTYIYEDRFGIDKSYVVPVELDSAYYASNNNSWLPNNELIQNNAPAIDDLKKDCTWVIDEASINGSEVTLRATHSTKTHTVTIKDDKADENFKELTFKPVTHNTYVKYKLDSNDLPVLTTEADEDGEFIYAQGDKFLYWLVTDTATGQEVAKGYYPKFAIKIVGDYTVTAVYGDEDTSNSVTISEPSYTREQYTNADGSNAKDYLYVDFILAYMSKDGALIKDNTTSYDTGIIFEIDKNSKLTADDIASLTDENSEVTINNLIAKYNFESDNDTIIKYAQTLDNNEKVLYKSNAELDSNDRILYNFEIDESKYNNFNRVSFYLKFSNSSSNRSYVMKAYYYVNELDAEGNVTTKLSAPVYFNLYEIGTQDVNIG